MNEQYDVLRSNSGPLADEDPNDAQDLYSLSGCRELEILAIEDEILRISFCCIKWENSMRDSHGASLTVLMKFVIWYLRIYCSTSDLLLSYLFFFFLSGLLLSYLEARKQWNLINWLNAMSVRHFFYLMCDSLV